MVQLEEPNLFKEIDRFVLAGGVANTNAKYAFLKEKGVVAIVSLIGYMAGRRTTGIVDHAVAPKYGMRVYDFGGAVGFGRLGSPVKENDLLKFFEIIRSLPAGKKIYVHCYAGSVTTDGFIGEYLKKKRALREINHRVKKPKKKKRKILSRIAIRRR